MKEFRKKANQGSFRKTFRKNPSQPWETIERATMAYTQQWCFRSNRQCMSVLVKAFPRLTRLCLPSDDSCTRASHATWRELYPFRSHIEMHLTTPAPQQRAQNRGPKIWSHHLLLPKLFFFFFLKKTMPQLFYSPVFYSFAQVDCKNFIYSSFSLGRMLLPLFTSLRLCCQIFK